MKSAASITEKVLDLFPSLLVLTVPSIKVDRSHTQEKLLEEEKFRTIVASIGRIKLDKINDENEEIDNRNENENHDSEEVFKSCLVAPNKLPEIHAKQQQPPNK